MSAPVTNLKYGGTALPADSDTETLFDSTSLVATGHNKGASAGLLGLFGWQLLGYEVDHSHQGIVKGYFSDDGGTTWRQDYEFNLAPHHASKTNFDEVNIAGRRDYKLEWVNGGTTQTTFNPQIVAYCDATHPSRFPMRYSDYVSGGDVDTTQNFDWIRVGPERHVTMRIAVTSGSSPNGTWKLEFTGDGGDGAIEVGGSSGEFTDLTGSNVDFDANWVNLPGDFVRLVYTRSSGTGTLNVQATSF